MLGKMMSEQGTASSHLVVISSTVMAGLDPAIHVLFAATNKQGVDARHKAGHDELGVSRRRPP
jgi:hypothetical protein